MLEVTQVILTANQAPAPRLVGTQGLDLYQLGHQVLDQGSKWVGRLRNLRPSENSLALRKLKAQKSH